MSRTIDQRVVEMQFDNKHFERNVQTSLSTLDKLKQSLNLTGATKGLEEVDRAAKKVSFSSLGVAVENVGLKFNALYTIADQTFRRITDSAFNTGKRIASALTIDPIKTGFQEYETQIGAVQTILANTSHNGTNLQQVNAALDELNTYADKTIYNFTEMTRNIGTFTAAGVDLRTSVDSIKGIANLAAVSGSTSQQASTAMYQLSQALAAGKVSLMDWNSVVNAGMGGKVFQDALIRTSELLGTNAKAAINTYGSFRESLTKGEWLTTEVLTETLKQFAGAYSEADLIAQGFTKKQAEEITKMADTAEQAATKVKTFTQLWDTLKESAQSGWTQSWEIIIGDFEEAKAALTRMSDTIGGMIGNAAESRNKMLGEGLSSGWKQLLSAGIADEAGFIESIQNVAKESGDAFDKILDSLEDGETFTDGLKKGLTEGVISADTLTEGVYRLQEKMSGMSAEERKAAGYTNEMVEEIEKLSSGLKDGSISMDEFVEKILRPSGRENLIEALWNAFEGLLSVIKPVKEAFRDIFPAMTGDQLYKITENIRAFTETLTLSETASKNLKRTFKGVFAVVDIVRMAFVAVLDALKPLLGTFGDLSGGLLETTASWGDWLVNLRDTIKTTDIFNTIAQRVSQFVKTIANGAKQLYSAFKEKIVAPGLEFFSSLLDRVKERMSSLSGVADGIKTGVVGAFDAMGMALSNCDFFKLLGVLWQSIKTLGTGIASALGSLTEGLISKLGNADFNGFFDIINTIISGGIGVGVMKFLKSVTDTFSSFQDITDGIVDVFDGVRGCFEAYQTQLKAGTLMKIASAIAILVAALVVVSLIDSEKLSAAVGAITMLFADLVGAMALLGKIIPNLKGVAATCLAMTSMSVAVLILASALKKIADLGIDGILAGLVGVIGLTGTLVAAAKILGSGGNSAIKGAAQMVIFAAAIRILANVCESLAILGWEGLTKGLVGVGVLLAEVSLFMNTAKFSGKSIATATGIVILAGALKILASVCGDFARMNWEDIGKSLVAIGVLLAEIAAFTNFTGNAKHVISTGIALIAIAAAMKIFASAMSDFGQMKWGEIGKSLVAMAGALAAVTIAVNLMPTGMVAKGVGLIAVAAALIILANALEQMGNMSWESIAKGLVTLGGSMLILALGLKAMTGTLAGSAALLVATASLAILTPVLMALGSMSWESIAKGLVAIAGAFAIFGVAGLVLAPIVPTMLALGAAFSLLGVGVLALGGGLIAVAAAFTALATAGSTGATALVAALGIIVVGIASLIPVIITKIGEGIIAFCKVIAEGAPAIGEAIKAVVLSLVDVLVTCIPAISEGALQLLVGVLSALVEYTPQVVDLLFKFVVGLLDGLAEHLPELIQAAVNVVMSFFSGIVDAIKGIDVGTLFQGIIGVALMTGVMAALSAAAALVPGAMIGVLGMGAVIAELALVLAAVGALAQIPGLDWLISEGGDLLKNIGNAIGGFVGGIVGGIAEGITAALPQIGKDLSEFMVNLTPFLIGARLIDEGMMNGVKAIAETILLLTGANILESLTSWFTGGSSLATFGAQLPQLATDLNSFATNLGSFDESKVTTVRCATDAIKALAQAADALPNEGGWAAKICGDNSIATFGSYLPQLGSDLNAFATNLGTFGEDKVTSVTCAANAIKALAQAADALPNEGGWAAKIFGDNSIAAFGSHLPDLGSDLNAFATNLGTFDENTVATVTCAGNAIKALAKASQSIDGQAEWAKKLFGDNGLSAFGDELGALGSDLSTFVENLGTFGDDKVTTVNAAVKAVNALAGLADSNLKGAKKNLEGFGEKVVDLADDISSFVDGMPASSDVSTAISNVDKILKMIKDIAGADANIAVDFTNALKDIGKAGVKAFVEAFTSSSAKTDVKKAAVDLMGQVVKGAESKKDDIKKSFKEAVGSGVDGIKDKYQAFYDAGKYLVDGFAAGISENDYKAEAKAKAMAKAAADAAQKALKINSPSKVFKAIGTSVPEGFALGISKLGSDVRSSSVSMADQAISSVGNAMTRIADAINNDIDAEPTIRPVVDMSNVRSSANSINSLFGGASVGVVARANAINASMNSNRQNGTSTEVVSEIKKLRSDMGKIKGDTYNINGVSYDGESDVANAIRTITKAAIRERRT